VVVAAHDKRGVQAGVRVRNARRARGFTQRELAPEAGISIGALRDLEQGRVLSPQPDTVARLGRILGLHDECPAGPGGLWIGMLGPLVVFREGRSVALRTEGQRAILGMLALGCGDAVRQDAIVDALWGGNPPRTATATVHCYISRLRSVLDMPGGAVLFRNADRAVPPGEELRAARTAVVHQQVPSARFAPDLWQDDGVLPLPVP
jgi:transcriptional regulator with XRE-family HTH domain